jgi:outer membrane protein TolC
MISRCRARVALAAAALLLILPFAGAVPIDLSRAELMALNRSADLRSLENRAAATACALKLGFRDYFPQVSLGYLDSSNIVRGGADAASIEWSMTVTQPLFDGGRARRQRRLSEADLELQRRGIKDKEREIRESVDSAYHGVLMLKRKIEIQEGTLATTDQELEIARAQRSLGSIREIDLLQSELQRSAMVISIQSSEASLEESEFSLKQLLGLRSDAPLDIVDDFDPDYGGLALPEDPRFLGALVLEGNLGLRQKQAELRKKLAALIEAREWYLPKVSLEGTMSLSGERYPLQSASVNGKLVFEISAPTSPASFSLSSGGSTGKQKANGSSINLDAFKEPASLADDVAAANEYNIMKQQIDEMSDALEFQVRKSVAAYIRDRASLELQRGDLSLQRKTAEIQKRLLDIGEGTRVDYLKTLTTAAEGESTILESVLKLCQSESELERLLGLESGDLARVSSSFVAKGR